MKKSLLQAFHVSKWYGSHRALHNFTFDFKPGEILALLGANGAGKSTISSILASLRTPTSGEITYEGISIYDDIVSYRSLIGYCPQKSTFNNLMTVYENLWFSASFYGISRSERETRIHELAERFELVDHMQKYPDELSGGLLQRCTIARALLHNPKIIILDEPTVGLDPHVRRNLWDIIAQLKNPETIIILTTHYLDEAEYLADRLCVLKQGEIALIDTPKNLMSSKNAARLEDAFVSLMEEK
jgi:ABC-2 type transport system ATP-binding protein